MATAVQTIAAYRRLQSVGHVNAKLMTSSRRWTKLDKVAFKVSKMRDGRAPLGIEAIASGAIRIGRESKIDIALRQPRRQVETRVIAFLNAVLFKLPTKLHLGLGRASKDHEP